MKKLLFLLLATSLLSLYGCSSLRTLKASEADDHGFVPNPEALTEMTEVRPFHRSWITKDKSFYLRAKELNTGVYVVPVSTSIVEARIREEFDDPEEQLDRIEEVQELGEYFAEKVRLVVASYPNHPLKLAEHSDDEAFTIHLALVEVEATSITINTLGTAAGFFVPGGGLIKTLGKGSVAMEGYIESKKPKGVVEQFKDRETDKAAPFTIKDFQRYAHVRSSLDDWAMQIAEIMAKPIDAPIADSLPFELSPL